MINSLKIGSKVVSIQQGSVVHAGTDAIVNAANDRLAHGSGLCGAIYAAAGTELEALTVTMGGCPTGQAKITPAFNLKTSQYIIHAVGPVYNASAEDKCRKLLASAYQSSLEVAEKQGLKSIGLPSLSTGIFSYPVEKATPVAVQAVVDYLQQHPSGSLSEVKFYMYHSNEYDVFCEALGQVAAKQAATASSSPSPSQSDNMATTPPIYFYDRDKPYYSFTNFANHSFELDGYQWKTSEHYFQAQKFVGTPYFDQVRQAPYPSNALDIARQHQAHRRAGWFQIRDAVMLKAVLRKFESNPTIKAELLSTGMRELIEDSPSDDYWGIGKDKTGKNRLGQILMEVRDMLRKSTSQV